MSAVEFSDEKVEELAYRLKDVLFSFISEGKHLDYDLIDFTQLDENVIRTRLREYAKDHDISAELGISEDQIDTVDIQNLDQDQLKFLYQVDIDKLQLDFDLMDDLGMDSIEAFESISALHELIDAEIPQDLDPASITNIRDLSRFMLENYTTEQIEIILSDDFPDRVKEIMNDNSLDDDFEGEF